MEAAGPFVWNVDLDPRPRPVEGNGHAEPSRLAEVVELEERAPVLAGLARLAAFVLVAAFALGAGLWVSIDAVVTYVRGFFG